MRQTPRHPSSSEPRTEKEFDRHLEDEKKKVRCQPHGLDTRVPAPHAPASTAHLPRSSSESPRANKKHFRETVRAGSVTVPNMK